ncbi:MAG TPA: hypothetical protein VK674_02200 [Candidatus Limnocylindria bacterium]|nr:hypothetical protein [Candidatus Limnocylindria bacterium]
MEKFAHGLAYATTLATGVGIGNFATYNGDDAARARYENFAACVADTEEYEPSVSDQGIAVGVVELDPVGLETAGSSQAHQDEAPDNACDTEKFAKDIAGTPEDERGVVAGHVDYEFVQSAEDSIGDTQGEKVTRGLTAAAVAFVLAGVVLIATRNRNPLLK